MRAGGVDSSESQFTLTHPTAHTHPPRPLKLREQTRGAQRHKCISLSVKIQSLGHQQNIGEHTVQLRGSGEGGSKMKL